MWLPFFSWWKPLHAGSSRDALLHHPDFRVVHVAGDGEKRSMRVVCPATDKYHRHKLATQACHFYALSHLWGTDADKHQWNDVGDYIHSHDGRPIDPIPMRPEKRDTLLSLLESHPDSYWWIDVVCARSDMPLVIMGGIYRYCDRCYAMVDCSPTAMDMIAGQRLLKMCADFHYVEPYFRLTANWTEQVRALTEFLDCRWWQRVWTWQEMALQKHVFMISERSGKRPMDRANVLEAAQLVQLYKMRAYYDRCKDTSALEKQHALVDPDMMVAALEKIARQCAEVFRPRNFAELSAHGYASSSLYAFFKFIESLGNSPRTCMDPVDYVYGVIGFMLWHIPRMSCPHDVWRAFLSKLQEYITCALDESQYMHGGIISITISDHARTLDLTAVKSMTDVYKGLLEVTTKNGTVIVI